MTSEDDIKNYATYFQKYPKIYDNYRLDFGVREELLKINKGFPRGVSELGIILFLKMKDNIVILSRYC